LPVYQLSDKGNNQQLDLMAAAYVLDIGELVCVKLGQDIDVGRVQGIRGGKVIIRTIGDEEISCVPDDLIDNSFEEDEDQEDIVEDLRMEDEEEEEEAWEAWSEDLASSALPTTKTGEHSETARRLVHLFLQTRDADCTLSHLTPFVEQKFERCLSLFLRMIGSVPEPPSVEYLVLFHLMMLLLSTKISPDHRARFSTYFCKVYDENRAFYTSNGLGELEL
jgi:hypothetical protein